jgi:hypothetical protein
MAFKPRRSRASGTRHGTREKGGVAAALRKTRQIPGFAEGLWLTYIGSESEDTQSRSFNGP